MSFKASFGIGLAAVGLSLGALVPVPTPAQKAPPKPTYAKDVRPILKQYCVSCHSGATPAAGLNLTKIDDPTKMVANRAAWDKIVRNVSAGLMPPQGLPKPTAAQRKQMVAAIESAYTQDCNLADPGRVTIRRLNRAEYDNTVRDLTGVDLKLGQDFPSDDVGYGFDNIGDVLSISSLLMERYLDAADRIAEAAILVPGSAKQTYAGAEFADYGAEYQSTGKLLYSNGEAHLRLKLARPGIYMLRLQLSAQQAGPEPAKAGFRVDGKDVAEWVVANKPDKPQWVEVRHTFLAAGSATLSVSFKNDYYEKEVGDRNLIIHAAEVVGPIQGSISVPESHRRIIPKLPDPKTRDADIRAMLARLATRAYRRPAKSEEVDRLVGLVKRVEKAGEPFERAMQVALQAVLVSPNFLFRVELDDPRKGPKRELSDFELASRLSYFLWSSMPDETLSQLARAGKLKDPAQLSLQVDRMLKDPKSSALADNFAMQWLQLRKLQTMRMDPEHFPPYSDELRNDMLEETRRFFLHVVRQDRPIIDFLNADYSFVNERLAKLYGLADVSGAEFRRVQWPAKSRAGLLAQASVLTVTSNPTRTSPTKRGKWVLENILGTPPPPPPPGVGDIADEKKKLEGKTLRELMEEHRKNPTCAGCHARMDPIGFGLENFDGIGRWRTMEGKTPVDATGKLPNGKAFNGPIELRAILLSQRSMFASTLAERMMTYALGRGVTLADKCFVDEAAARAAKRDYRFSELVKGVVLSDAFRMRGGPLTK
jgi:hypothetical protein